MEEASTHFDAYASQDEASYDGDVSAAEEDDIEVVPDKVDDTQVKSSKPVGAISAADKEVLQATNKSGGGQTLKSGTRIQLVNPATRLHLGPGMGLSVMIEASSLRDAGTNICKTTFQCTVSSGQVMFFL